MINLKEQSGELRHHTVVRYKELLKRINEGIGHIKLCDIRPQHLNALYEQLSKEGLRKNGAKAILKNTDLLHEMISAKGYTSRETFIRDYARLSCSTYRKAIKSGRLLAVVVGLTVIFFLLRIMEKNQVRLCTLIALQDTATSLRNVTV